MSGSPVALVTGAATGIGAACARALAGEGFQVGIHYRSSAEKAQKLLSEIPGAFGLRADLSNPEDIDAMIKEIQAGPGRVDVLVNNAGYNENAPMLTMKLDSYDAVAGLARGTWYLTKLVLRRFMLRKDKGRIINISSVVGSAGNAGQANYAAAKAGIEGFTRALALEVASRHITVNAVAPGLIETDMTDALDATTRTHLLDRIPLGTLGQTTDVAEAVSFLASPGASYITGHILHVNGGMYMH